MLGCACLGGMETGFTETEGERPLPSKHACAWRRPASCISVDESPRCAPCSRDEPRTELGNVTLESAHGPEQQTRKRRRQTGFVRKPAS